MTMIMVTIWQMMTVTTTTRTDNGSLSVQVRSRSIGVQSPRARNRINQVSCQWRCIRRDVQGRAWAVSAVLAGPIHCMSIFWESLIRLIYIILWIWSNFLYCNFKSRHWWVCTTPLAVFAEQIHQSSPRSAVSPRTIHNKCNWLTDNMNHWSNRVDETQQVFISVDPKPSDHQVWAILECLQALLQVCHLIPWDAIQCNSWNFLTDRLTRVVVMMTRHVRYVMYYQILV